MARFHSFILVASLACGCISVNAENLKGFGETFPSAVKPTKSIQVTSREISTITVMPSPGAVNSIDRIQIAFIGAESVKLYNTTEEFLPTLKKTDGTVITSKEIKVESNALVIDFGSAVTAEGIYTLNVSRLCVKVEGVPLTNDLSYTYIIGKASDSGIIYETPPGEKVICQSDFLSYFVIDGGLSGMPLAGKPLHYIIGEDGNLYLYNIMTIQPYGGVQTSSYVVGTPSSENRWKFSFPQPIYETVSNSKPEIWYLNYLYTYIDQKNQTGTYKIYDEANYVEFTIDENGNAVWVVKDSEVDDGFAIGATTPDGIWTGFANVMRSTYSKFDETAPNIDPQNYEIWKLTTGPSSKRVSRNVDVYFEGNDIWIRGFSKTYLPEAWAHGVIDGKTITFDQYIGECEMIGQYLFLNGYTDAEGRTNLQFKYYPEEKGMTCNTEYIINPNQVFYYAVEHYEYPSLEYASSGVYEIETDCIVLTEWYTLEGIKISEPTNGICVKRTTDTSGNVNYVKTIIR